MDTEEKRYKLRQKIEYENQIDELTHKQIFNSFELGIDILNIIACASICFCSKEVLELFFTYDIIKKFFVLFGSIEGLNIISACRTILEKTGLSTEKQELEIRISKVKYELEQLLENYENNEAKTKKMEF